MSELFELKVPDRGSDLRRKKLGRRAQLLAGASVSYNLVEAVVAISAGSVAGSVALVGFGLDSVVEVASGLIILWQFRHPLPETRERRALRLIALSFFGLAAYVGFESVRGLLGQHESDTSGIGIGLAIASLIVMPLLSYAQRRTGKALNSNAVVADSTQTLLCTYLSAVLLIGLLLNATLGWYWADPRCRLGDCRDRAPRRHPGMAGQGLLRAQRQSHLRRRLLLAIHREGRRTDLTGGAVAALTMATRLGSAQRRPRSTGQGDT